MTRAEATRKLHSIYRRLKNDEIKGQLNRKLGRLFGMASVEEGYWKMQINPVKPWRSKGGFVHTVLHEMIHITWWGIPEKEVAILEHEMFDALSDRQLGNLLKRVFNAAFRQ